ncbi:MAG: acyl-CoA desaturase [Bacteroidota bacterium]
MQYTPVRFSRTINKDFISVLRSRVKNHFKENGISTYGNSTMVLKTVVLMLMYLVPFSLVAFGLVTNPWLYFGLWIIMGFAVAGIGMSIMHDAVHGSYSKNNTVNTIVGYVLNMVGGIVATWRIQHNRLHHTFTNIDGHDTDIDAGVLMRFSPNQKRYWMHRFQVFYAWFLYGLMTMSWITMKDFNQLKEFKERGLLGKDEKKYNSLITKAVLQKILYYSVTLGIPLMFSPFSWWFTVLGFLAMQFLAGLILACVFQLAHVMPECEFPVPTEENKIENNWAVHQLQTTCNFSPNSKIMSWYVGGLNYQIEHHLFPNICHVHYPRIAKIVKETAKEFNLPYHVQPTFVHALVDHGKMLFAMGTKD